jgi:hypothetical protein
MQNEFAGKPISTLAFDDRTSDLGVHVIERGHQQPRFALFAGPLRR